MTPQELLEKIHAINKDHIRRANQGEPFTNRAQAWSDFNKSRALLKNRKHSIFSGGTLEFFAGPMPLDPHSRPYGKCIAVITL